MSESIDRRLTRQIGLFHPRALLARTGRTTELCQVRDGQDRVVFGFHETVEARTGDKIWIEEERALRHGDGRRSLQVLPDDEEGTWVGSLEGG